MHKLVISIAVLLTLADFCQEAYASPNNGKKVARTSLRFSPQAKRAGHVYIPKIDNRSRTFYIDGTAYFCYEGIYYQYVQGKGYEEIQIPENVVVQDLPYGARRTYVNGYSYYNADGMWFQPISNGFLIVDQPCTSDAAYDPLPSKTYKATFGY